MLSVEAVDWLDPRAIALREAMDAETRAMYAKFVEGQTLEVRAGIDEALAVDPATIDTTIIALDGAVPVGHAALRPVDVSVFGADVLEVKKVFVVVEARGRGVARLLMSELETMARERRVASLVLQTGELQLPAIRLYEELAYLPIPAFGKYTAIPGALCFAKEL